MISGTIIPTPLPGQRASGPIGRGGRLLYLTLGLSYIASYYFYEPILLIGLAGLTTALFRPIRLTDLAFAFLVIDIRAEGIESAINYSFVLESASVQPVSVRPTYCNCTGAALFTLAGCFPN